jgi:hypothetical protein
LDTERQKTSLVQKVCGVAPMRRSRVQASSTYDAAHLFVVHAKTTPASQLPIPTLASIFEVVAAGRLYCINCAALQKWILQSSRNRKDQKSPCLASALPYRGER